MANNRFVFEGLAELKAALRALPDELTGEASHIIEAAANGAATTVKQVYGEHRVTGHLQNSVDVLHTAQGKFAAGFTVKVSDPIAWLWDNGSQARHWASGKSTGAMWGHSAPTHVFVRTMMRARRAMYGQLKDLLTRKGLLVSGNA